MYFISPYVDRGTNSKMQNFYRVLDLNCKPEKY